MMNVFEATGAFDKSMFYKESNDDEVVVSEWRHSYV